MALGQAVDPVVEQQDLEIHVASQGVDEVVATDGQGVAVAGDDPDGQVGAADGQSGGDGGCAAVDRMQSVGVQVVRESTGAADPGDEDDVLATQSQTRQEPLDGGEYRVVAAPWAPADFLVALELLRRQRFVGLGDQVEGGQIGGGHVRLRSARPVMSGWSWPISLRITSARSSERKGSPRTWL